MASNYARVLAIKKTNTQRLLKLNPQLTNDSGIYILTREENGLRFGYIGQAVHILDRLCSHLTGYQHIDLSIKKHGLYDKDKRPNGYKVEQIVFPKELLDEKEREYITTYANLGYQLRNKTSGGQDSGKVGINDNDGGKGYHDGLKQGYNNCLKEIRELFTKYLVVLPKTNDKKKNGEIKEIYMRKFNEFKELMERGK